MSPQFRLVLRLIVGLQVLNASALYACACCADSGFSVVRHDVPQSNESLALFGALGFRAVANVHAVSQSRAHSRDNAGGPHAEPGLVELRFATNNGSMVFSAHIENVGSFHAVLPSHFSRSIRQVPGTTDDGLGVPLEKILLLSGQAWIGTGVFSHAGRKQIDFELQFSGQGNACTSSDDFKRWSLALSGPDVEYVISGDRPPHQ